MKESRLEQPHVARNRTEMWSGSLDNWVAGCFSWKKSNSLPVFFLPSLAITSSFKFRRGHFANSSKFATLIPGKRTERCNGVGTADSNYTGPEVGRRVLYSWKTWEHPTLSFSAVKEYSFLPAAGVLSPVECGVEGVSYRTAGTSIQSRKPT